MTNQQPPQTSATDNDNHGIYLAGALAIALALWLVPAFAGLVGARALPDMSAVEQILGTLRIATDGHLANPRAGYPATAHHTLPAGLWFYLCAGIVIVPLALALASQWQRIDRLRSRAHLGRSELDPRGSSPTDWARPRDLPELVGHQRGGERFSLGRLRGRAISSDPESQVIVVAPPGAGKTTRCVVPWLLEHDGPAIVTSTKNDIAAVCSRWRGQLGDVHVWDPFDPNGSTCWTPLDGCEDWGYALHQAFWLAQAATGGKTGHGDAHFWDEESTTLLAPLLHAAALSGSGMDTVISWLDRQDQDSPRDILRSDGTIAATDQLGSIFSLDPRNQSTYFISCKRLLRAYRHPEVKATSKPGLTPADFLDGGAHTLFLTASQANQQMLAPLITAIISSLLHKAKENVRVRGLDGPLLRVLLDEAGQIAPLHDLPGQLAEARGQNIRFALIYQTVAQVTDRHGVHGAKAMLGAATTRLYMGPITDDETRHDITGLLGDRNDPRRNGHRRPAATPQELIQLDVGRAILLAGSNPPAIVTLDPYWELKDLTDRADHQQR